MTTETKNTKGFAVIGWKALKKGLSLQGFLDIETSSGMRLYGCTLHRLPDNRRWVGLPAKSFSKDDGSLGCTRIVDFDCPATYSRFQHLALAAVDRYFSQNPKEMPTGETSLFETARSSTSRAAQTDALEISGGDIPA